MAPFVAASCWRAEPRRKLVDVDCEQINAENLFCKIDAAQGGSLFESPRSYKFKKFVSLENPDCSALSASVVRCLVGAQPNIEIVENVLPVQQ
jgi:hypothetical protein